MGGYNPNPAADEPPGSEPGAPYVGQGMNNPTGGGRTAADDPRWSGTQEWWAAHGAAQKEDGTQPTTILQNPYNPLTNPARYTNFQNLHPEAVPMSQERAMKQPTIEVAPPVTTGETTPKPSTEIGNTGVYVVGNAPGMPLSMGPPKTTVVTSPSPMSLAIVNEANKMGISISDSTFSAPFGIRIINPFGILHGVSNFIFPGSKTTTTTTEITAPLPYFINQREGGSMWTPKMIGEDNEMFEPVATSQMRGEVTERTPSGLESFTGRPTENPLVTTAVIMGAATGVGKFIGDYTEKGYDIVGAAPVPRVVKGYLNAAVGFGGGVAGMVPFLLMIPSAAEYTVRQPLSVPSKLVSVGTDMITGITEREMKSPGSAVGTFVGMYAGGKAIGYTVNALPIKGFNLELPIGDSKIYPTAEDAFFQNKFAKYPVVKGFYDQFFGGSKEFSNINTYSGVRVGETPLITYARGATVEPDIVIGKQAFVDVVTSQPIEIQTTFAKYAPKVWTPMERMVATKIMVGTAEDSFTMAMITIDQHLARATTNLAGKYIATQPIGVAEQFGTDFAIRVGMQKALGYGGEKSITVGSRAMVDLIGPEFYRDVTGSDVDVSSMLSVQPTQYKILRETFGGTDIGVRRLTVWDGTFRNKQTNFGETGMGINEPPKPTSYMDINTPEFPIEKLVGVPNAYYHATGISSWLQSLEKTGSAIIDTSNQPYAGGVFFSPPNFVDIGFLHGSMGQYNTPAIIKLIAPATNPKIDIYSRSAWPADVTHARPDIFKPGKLYALPDGIGIVRELVVPDKTVLDYVGSYDTTLKIPGGTVPIDNIVSVNGVDTVVSGGYQSYPETKMTIKIFEVRIRGLDTELMVKHSNNFEVTTKLPKTTPLPEKRGMSFGVKGEEHTIGFHPLEYNTDIYGMPMPNIYGGTTWIQTPENAIRTKLSRVVGTGSMAEKPAVFEYNPDTGLTTVKTTGGKQVSDLVDIYAISRYIAKTAYDNRLYDLGRDWEGISDSIGLRLQNRLDTNIGDVIPKDILEGVPRGPSDIGTVLGVGLGGIKTGVAAEYPAKYPSKIEPNKYGYIPLLPYYGGYRGTSIFDNSLTLGGYPLSHKGGVNEYPTIIPPEYPTIIPPINYPSGGIIPDNHPTGGIIPDNYPTGGIIPDNYPTGGIIPNDYPGGGYNGGHRGGGGGNKLITTRELIITTTIIPAPEETQLTWWKKRHKVRPFRFVELFSYDLSLGTTIPFRFGKGGEKVINPPMRFLEAFSYDLTPGTTLPFRFGKGGRGGMVANPNNIMLEGPGIPIEKVVYKKDIAGQMKWYKYGARLLNDTQSPKPIVVPQNKNIKPMHRMNIPKNPFALKGK